MFSKKIKSKDTYNVLILLMLKTRWMCQCGCTGISFNIILCTFVGDLVQSGNIVVLLCRVCVGCAGSGPTQLRSYNGRL